MEVVVNKINKNKRLGMYELSCVCVCTCAGMHADGADQGSTSNAESWQDRIMKQKLQEFN